MAIGDFFRNLFNKSTHVDRVAAYVIREHERGRSLTEILEDDLSVSERDGRSEHVRPFTRKELLGPLERWFFGHSPR